MIVGTFPPSQPAVVDGGTAAVLAVPDSSGQVERPWQPDAPAESHDASLNCTSTCGRAGILHRPPPARQHRHLAQPGRRSPGRYRSPARTGPGRASRCHPGGSRSGERVQDQVAPAADPGEDVAEHLGRLLVRMRALGRVVRVDHVLGLDDVPDRCPVNRVRRPPRGDEDRVPTGPEQAAGAGPGPHPCHAPVSRRPNVVAAYIRSGRRL